MRETNSICKRHKRSSQVALGFLKSSQIVNVHTAPQAFETSLKDLDLKSKRLNIERTVVKGDEFKGNALSNTVASFFNIFFIVLLVECEKNWRPCLTECCC